MGFLVGVFLYIGWPLRRSAFSFTSVGVFLYIGRCLPLHRMLGGRYGTPRLQGVLAVTRALGDVALKPHGLIAQPSVVAHSVTDNGVRVRGRQPGPRPV
jgi:hypothetical protein